MRSSSHLLLRLPWLAIALLGCGGPQADTDPATHDDFAAIQQHEATLEEARGAAGHADVPCEQGCAAVPRGCAAARRICRIADATADLDARARCRRAEDVCRATRSEASRRCACPADEP